MIMEKSIQQMWEDILEMCQAAYKEGREHQFHADWPDVGMYFKKDFSDTKHYKLIMKKIKGH